MIFGNVPAFGITFQDSDNVTFLLDLKNTCKYINGPPTDKRDFTTKFENLQMMHIFETIPENFNDLA